MENYIFVRHQYRIKSVNNLKLHIAVYPKRSWNKKLLLIKKVDAFNQHI